MSVEATTAATPPPADRASRRRVTRSWSPGVMLGLYVVAQAISLGFALFGTFWVGVFGGAATGVLALVGLCVGIRHFRPSPATGWWLIVAGTLVTLLASLGLVISNHAPELRTLMYTSDGLRFLRYVLLGAGLVLIGRTADRKSEINNIIDAGIAGAGLFLLLWAVVISPSPQPEIQRPAVFVILVPAAALIVFAIAVKLVFTVGARLPALFLLVGGTCGVLLGPLLAQLLGSTGGGGPWLPRILVWGGLAVIGAAGLHPSLREAGSTPVRASIVLTRQRLILFGLLGLLCPYAWLLEVWDRAALRNDPLGPIVPITVSAILVLLLVARLAMMTRVAQDRADDLSQQADALGEALQEQEALQSQLTYRALHDPLTGLANRVVLAERMEWALARREGGNNALILLDLDGFKDINDTYGHPTGDAVLIEVARRLVEGAPRQGILARLGGDEFAIFLEDIDPRQVRVWADEIRRSIARPFEPMGHELFLTVSIGLFLSKPSERVSPSTALSDADLALYAAKDRGRNRVVAFRPYLRRARLDRTRMSTGLRQALIDDEFSVQYQPMVDLANERIIAVEALLRWTQKDGQRIPPTAFIPVAEETGVINMIGAWVLRKACADAASWYRDHGISVSVNVSGRQLDDIGFADMVIDVLRDCDLPGEALILELTETTLVSLSSTAIAVAQLRRLRDHGIRIAVDDFGTGYSSLAYVSRLPVDIIKLDRSFTQDSRPDASLEGWAFIRAILQLVDSVGLQTVAEGIETAKQAEVLRQLHCPLAQGYLFSRPVNAEAISRSLVASSDPAALGR